MQRLFVMFPDRAPGVGLVLLRLGLCAAVLTLPMASTGWLQLASTGWLQLASLAAACLLLVGVWTPLAAVALLLMMGLHAASHWAWLPLPVALLLLGPGAYSLDARRFGRRVLRQPLGGSSGRDHPKE